MDLKGIVVESISFTRYESRKSVGLQAFASIRLNGVVAIQDIRIERTEEGFIHAMLPTRLARTKCAECGASGESRYEFCPNCASKLVKVPHQLNVRGYHSIVFFVDKSHAHYVRTLIVQAYKDWLASVWGEHTQPEGEDRRTHLRLSRRRGQQLKIGNISVTFLQHGEGPTKTGLFECQMGSQSAVVELYEKRTFDLAPEITIRYARRGASSCEVFIAAPSHVKIDGGRDAEEVIVGNHDQ